MDYKDYMNQFTVGDDVKRDTYNKMKQSETAAEQSDGAVSGGSAPQSSAAVLTVARPKKRLAIIATVCAAAILVTATVLPFSLHNMSGGKSNFTDKYAQKLGAPAKAAEFTYDQYKDNGYLDIQAAANAFAYDFSAQTYSCFGNDKNLAVSPVSVYMALSIAAECAAGQTREEIVSALGVPYDTLRNDFNKLYNSLIKERTTDTGSLISKLSLTNSIWLNSGMQSLNIKDLCIKSLSDNYYCHSYSADFTHDNKNANLALQQFVKEQTNNLINRDFQITDNASFILMNTLYLKDLWNSVGDNLGFTSEKYDFTETSGGAKSVKLLQSYYRAGRTYQTETFTHYYTSSSTGYKIKFILPNEGYSVADVFTAENIEAVNTLTDYNALDKENLKKYNTRCLFPEFKASFDEDVKSILEDGFGITSMFDKAKSDFSSVSGSPNYCTGVRHVTELKVDKKGIEGAAVTVMPMEGTAAPGEDEYEIVYEDFIVDRAFGYVITDSYDTIIFTGVVNAL